MLLLLQDLTRDVVRLCARSSRPRNTRELGALVRVLCACVVYARANSLRTQREERVGAHGREDSAEKKTAHSSICNARAKSQPSLYTPFYSLSQRRQNFVIVVYTGTRVGGDRGTVEVGFAGRHGVLKGPSQSASAGSLSLHDTFCSIIIIFVRLCLTLSYPHHLLAVWNPIRRRKSAKTVCDVCVCVRERDSIVYKRRQKTRKKKNDKKRLPVVASRAALYAPRVAGEEENHL